LAQYKFFIYLYTLICVCFVCACTVSVVSLYTFICKYLEILEYGPKGQKHVADYLLSRPTKAQRIYIYIYIHEYISKAIPLQAWTGPEGFRRLRIPDFKTIGT